MRKSRGEEQIRANLLLAIEGELALSPANRVRTVADLIGEEWRRDPSRDRSELSIEIRALMAKVFGCPLARVRETSLVGDFLEILDDTNMPPTPAPAPTMMDEDDEEESAEAEGVHGGVHVDIVEALLMIEEELGKELPDKALGKAKTVGDLIAAYERLRVGANREQIAEIVRAALAAVFGRPVETIIERTKLDEFP